MQTTDIDWIEVAKLVLLSRELDLLEVHRLTPEGKVKYQFSSGGHELAQVLLSKALTHPHDGVTVYYRSRPFMLASGLTPEEALAANMAKTHSPSEGLDAGVMFNMPRRHGPNVLPTSGDVGAQYTPAVGWAQAIRYRERVLGESEWAGAMAAACGGDGSVAANGFWSALNIATTLKLPMLFFIEDNRYSLSVPASLQTPGGEISANLKSFGNLKVLAGDGTDPAEAWSLIWEAVSHVRHGEGPCLLHLKIVRLTGHTFIDDQAYKSAEMIAEEQARDPVLRLQSFLYEKGLSEAAWEEMRQEARARLEAALENVEDIPEPDDTMVRRYIYYEGVAPMQGGLRAEGILPIPGTTQAQSGGPRLNMVDAIRRTLESELQRNPRLLVFGEDVGRKGGVHGATMDLQKHFGEERVFDTSLSEEGIVGRATGLALAGLFPVAEIQFRKYADPAQEQIDDLGTIRWRTVNKFAAPVVVRIPVGFGKVTGDPWHSVNGEAIFAHLIGWRIAFPSNAADAVGLLRSALRGDDPTLFLEHRALLDTAEGRRPYPGDDYCLPFGKAAQLLEGDELVVIAWGAMVPRCLQAAQNFPGRVSLLDLRTIIPWDKELVMENVHHCGKVLIVHEDTRTVGFGSEIAATIAEEAFESLDAPVQRLAPQDVPTPYNIQLMRHVIPSMERIRAAMQALLEY